MWGVELDFLLWEFTITTQEESEDGIVVIAPAATMMVMLAHPVI